MKQARFESGRQNAYLEWISQAIKDKADVNIKRSSGKMQKGKVEAILTDDDVYVSFYDENNRFKALGKPVNIDEFMSWQDAEIVGNDNGEVDFTEKAVSGKIAKVMEVTSDIEPVAGLSHVESKDGFPVLSSADFLRMYNTDIRALGADGAATFNFQGFVKTEEGTYFKDVLATNGILKSTHHEGIHVGTDGIVDYHALMQNHEMKGPEEIGEYDIYISIPTSLQKEKGVVCTGDSCKLASDLEDWEEDAEEIYDRGDKGYIVVRLSLEPQEDKSARKKAEIIHNFIVSYIEKGKPLERLEVMVRELENRLMDISEQDLEKKYPKLG